MPPGRAGVKPSIRKRFFLKKEAKLLSVGARVGAAQRLNMKEFFGSFLQKRAVFFLANPAGTKA
jgi:hypothetical protein